MRRVLLTAAAIAAGLALAALGGCGAEPERERIAAVLSAGLTSDDPRVVCEGSLAPALLMRIYGGAAQCHETESQDSERVSQAQSVDVSGVRIDGGRATAVVTIHGGNHDGARGTLLLARHDGAWRVSDLSVGLLRSEFEASLRRIQSLDPSVRGCITARMRAIDDADFKQIAYGDGAHAKRRVTAIARACATRVAAAQELAV